MAIREVVSEGNVLTHHDLFAHFYPNQATYYSEKRILSKSMPIAGMIHSLMEPIRNKDITTEFISNKNKGPSILSMEALSLEFVSSIDFRRIQNIPAPVYTLIHSYTHTLIHSYTHTLINSYTDTLIHSYTHTLIHTHPDQRTCSILM